MTDDERAVQQTQEGETVVPPRGAEGRRAARLAVTQTLAEAATVAEAAPRILRAVCEGLGWDVGAFWALDRPANVLRCLDVWHGPRVRVEEFKAGTRLSTFGPGVGLPGRVWTTGRPAWILDVPRDANFPRAPIASLEGLHAALGCPVLFGADVLGVIEFFSRQLREPDADLLEMLTTIGGQIGQFLERKRIEQAVRASEERFARFMQHLPGLAWAKDVDGRYVYANDAAERAFGTPRAALYGKTDAEVFPADTAAQFRENDRRALDSGAGVQVIETLAQPGGQLHHSLVSKFLIPGPDGRPALLGGMAIDITERLRAEQELRAAQEHLHIVTESMSAPVTRCGRDLTYRWVNKPYADWLGQSPGEIVGRPILEVIGGEAFEALRPHFERVLSGQVVRYEERVRFRGIGPRWINAVYTPTFDPAGVPDGWVAVVLDIDDRKRAEESLREADRQKDEFLAMLAHELRNPLAPVRTALHILKQPGADAATHAQVRDMAERQVQHMARLLDDLLDVSRVSRGRIELRTEAVDVAAAIGRTVEAVRPLIEDRRHELTVSLPAGPVRVEVDPTRLEQVLTNLLNNAAKYTDPGGQIWVSARREGGEVVLRVRDTGIGIAPEVLPRVFDLFVRAEPRPGPAPGGVGVGLTLAKKLVELHGGGIEAASAGPGRGSEFVVRLPALAGPGDGESVREARGADAATLPRRRILVVDDNRDAADTLALLLRLAGQDVRAAYDGPSALAEAARFGPAMVFLDIGMPGMDGYEVARRLRRDPALGGVVLVAVTGWGQEEDRRRSREAGFDNHLVKPVEPEAVQKLLAGAPPDAP
jgi:PAS domain S-box-containing protein